MNKEKSKIASKLNQRTHCGGRQNPPTLPREDPSSWRARTRVPSGRCVFVWLPRFCCVLRRHTLIPESLTGLLSSDNRGTDPWEARRGCGSDNKRNQSRPRRAGLGWLAPGCCFLSVEAPWNWLSDEAQLRQLNLPQPHMCCQDYSQWLRSPARDPFSPKIPFQARRMANKPRPKLISQLFFRRAASPLL